MTGTGERGNGHLVIRSSAGAEPTARLPPNEWCRSTDLDADPVDILRWFVRRWSIEVTFAEVRRHLGVETQRQWSNPAIARTTPALLGLFTLVAVWADDLAAQAALTPRAANWYPKPLPTFSAAIAAPMGWPRSAGRMAHGVRVSARY
ncbi:MAG TPA: hypothetical protein VMI52_02760 [Acetobacteraceae bacterium]|nr:hypothetical protein [Acetobacteraceae bacterium]